MSQLDHLPDYPHLSPLLLESLNSYKYEHIPTGGFLKAVIENDFSGAIGRASFENTDFAVLLELTWWLGMNMPNMALDFGRWTTCSCDPRDPDAVKCFVHTYPAEVVRSWDG